MMSIRCSFLKQTDASAGTSKIKGKAKKVDVKDKQLKALLEQGEEEHFDNDYVMTEDFILLHDMIETKFQTQ